MVVDSKVICGSISVASVTNVGLVSIIIFVIGLPSKSFHSDRSHILIWNNQVFNFRLALQRLWVQLWAQLLGMTVVSNVLAVTSACRYALTCPYILVSRWRYAPSVVLPPRLAESGPLWDLKRTVCLQVGKEECQNQVDLNGANLIPPRKFEVSKTVILRFPKSIRQCSAL